MIAQTIRVWAGAGMRKSVTCREKACRMPIELRITDRGKWMPFRVGAVPLHSGRDERGCVFELLSREDLHFSVCRAKRPAAGARA